MRPEIRNSPLAALVAIAFAATPAFAQDGPSLDPTGLLRTGLRLESSDTGGRDGFALYDARLGATGRIGIVFDYVAGVEIDTREENLRLLDAALSVPLRDEFLRLELGLARARFGGEALVDKGEIPFVERFQGSLALAPGRQLGLGLRGAALEGRLNYAGGIYNGNGPSWENDGDGFLWTARAGWNSVGEVEFFEDFVWEIAASVAFSEDSALLALPLSLPEEGVGRPVPMLTEFTGDRVIWGGNARVAWREFALAGEYLRTDFSPNSGSDLSSEGWYAQGSYTLWAAAEILARYDSFRTAGGAVTPGDETTKFLVLGINVLPGLYGRLGLQYAIGLDGTLAGQEMALDRTNTGPRLADGQFLLNLQVGF
ncbi:MAG: porin [Gemmatimonadota bacterium]|jgi:hypothetical protein